MPLYLQLILRQFDSSNEFLPECDYIISDLTHKMKLKEVMKVERMTMMIQSIERLRLVSDSPER